MFLVTTTTHTPVHIENVSFSYDGKTDALKDISLSVAHGDYLGLIGPNGGGKTTLIKLILGLLRPTSGSIHLFGADHAHFKEWYRIGYVSQQATKFDPLFPATVEEVVRMGRYGRAGLMRSMQSEDYERARAALEQVDMLSYKDKRVSDLSGGEKQRVFIARALAAEPDLIVLDEPTTGVDQETQDQFYELLKRLNKESSLTLMLVSHDLDRIAAEANHIAIVDTTLRYYDRPMDAVQAERSLEFHHDHV